MAIDFRWWRGSCVALAVILPVMAQAPETIEAPQQVLPLPGALDQVPVFNSNSPEIVQRPGILLSTFPPAGKATPSAHLDFPFRNRFDIFAHHIARPLDPQERTTLYLGILAYNPRSEPVTVNLIHAASYLSQPEAPFHSLPSQQVNDLGQIFAGPGDRVMLDILRQRRQLGWPAQV